MTGTGKVVILPCLSMDGGMDMNINMNRINLCSGYGLKSTQERMERVAKRDSQIEFYENQKKNLKNMKADSLEVIERKLELFHNYDEQIMAAKAEYNHAQMFHVMDEAMERAEQIAEEAEKLAPKTPEERREDMIEEITGVEKNDGLISELLEESIEETIDESIDELIEESDEKGRGLFEIINNERDRLEDFQLSEPDVPENLKWIDKKDEKGSQA